MAEAAVELRAILESAERAASAQDFASAEHYLHQAAVIQEAQFGPTHPELANTLNNLGIVLERLGKPADAEASYRRAYAIASATLAPDDPLVVTSGQNLRDFCAAAGKPFEVAPSPAQSPALPTPLAPAPVAPPASVAVTPPSPAAVTPPSPAAVTPRSPVATTASKPVETQAPPPVAATPLKPVATPPSKPVATPPSKPAATRAPKPVAAKPSKPAAAPPVSRRVTPDTPSVPPAVVRSSVRTQSTATRRTSLIWIGIAIAIVILAIFAWFTSASRTSDGDTATPPPVTTAPTPAPETAPAAETAPPREEPAPAKEVLAESRPAPPTAVDTAPPAARVVPSGRSASPGPISLMEAKLCRPLSLSDWQCTPVTNPAAPGGRLFFYTRVKADSDTTVQHRWYVDGDLLQSVNLRVRANSGAGFRTYSRNTVSAERRGTWTLELRDAGGALLHEERLVVQ